MRISEIRDISSSSFYNNMGLPNHTFKISSNYVYLELLLNVNYNHEFEAPLRLRQQSREQPYFPYILMDSTISFLEPSTFSVRTHYHSRRSTWYPL
jgi:hypothetical protein